MTFKTRWILGGVFTILALSLVAVFSVQGATSAQITTSQKLYSVGQTMVVNGTGFTPSAYIYLTVQRPDKLTDSVLPLPFTNGSGAFTASYTPPLIPGRYTITATDGSNTAVTAVTEADAIGYNKGVYNKAATAPENTTGNWTTGNAGSHYLENQWAFYQYEITGLGSTVPSFDVAFNHFQSNTKAIFVDAIADVRACVDCTDSSHTSGPSQGMLLDTVPLPPSVTTNWVLAVSALSHINRPLNSAADGSGSTVLTGSSGFCSSDTKEPIPDLVTTFPAEFHCFHVDGPTLGALFGSTLSSGTHTITLYYAAHLAASFVWGNGTVGSGGHEGFLGDCTSPYYVQPLIGPLSSFEPIIGLGPCTGHPEVYGTDDYAGWTADGFGVGFATGSSRHFSLSNQSAGSSGAIDLPIPTVAAPSNTIIITKVTSPAVATGVTFPFTGTLGPFNLDTDPGTATPSTLTFTGIAPGVPYSITEAPPGGWTNTALTCAFTAGTDDGTGSLTTNLGTSTAGITFGATDSSVTATCTYTNIGQGHIIVVKHTTPASSQSFGYTTTGTGYSGFSLINGGSNTDGGTPPAGGLTPGAYTISEDSVAGWALTSRTCSLTTTGSGTSTFPASGTTQPASITLGAGDTVTCVYNNSQPDANVTISPLSPVNEIGNAETFTITVTAIPNGASPVLFTSITPTVSPTAGLTTNTNTCAAPTIVANVATCTLTINSLTPGVYTAHVAAVVTIGGIALNRATGDSNAGDSADGVKHYVDANITIGPATATNEVNTAHTFTIVVTALPDSTGTPTFGPVTATVTPPPSTLGAVICAAPVGNVETCTLTINSTTAGTFTANASTTVTMGGVTVTRATNDTHVGDVGPAVKNYISSGTTLVFKSQSPSGTNIEVGTPVTITVTETNTGSGTIHGVSVTGSPCATWTPPGGFSGSLTAGASADFTCTFTAAAGTNNWSADGQGTDQLGNPVPSTGEHASGSFFGVTQGTTLTFKSQSPSGANLEVGTPVTITVTETNNGNTALTAVSVTGGPCALWLGPTTIALGGSADFTCTFTTAAGTNSWFADGHGTDGAGNPVSATGEHASGSFFGVTSGTTLTFKSQSPSGANLEVGTPVTITVTETNNGNTALTAVSVTGGPCALWLGPTTIALGGSADFTCTFTTAAGTNNWFADGHGTDGAGNPVSATGEHASGSFFGVTSGTTLTFKSQSPTGTVQAGTPVTITVTETNNGNTALTAVSVTGGPCALWLGPTTIALGGSADFTCTFTAVLGTNNWFADGHGTDGAGNPVSATGEHASGSFTGVLSTLIVVKHTLGGNGTFNYAGTGSGVSASFSIITSGLTGSVTFAGIPSGGKSITETVPAGWLGNTTNVSCAVIVPGVTGSSSSGLTTGEVAAGGTIAANVILGVGATVQCDFWNGLLPTLTIVKTIQGTGTATFTFPVTGDNTLNPTITPPTAPSTATYPPGPPTPPPGVVINVGSNGLTSNNTISEQGPPAGWTLTDFTCTGYTGGGAGAGPLDSNGVATNWNFIANFGNNVVCTFVNNNAQATRTQGFWATHTKLANDVWNGTNLPTGATAVIGSGDEVFGPGAGCPVAFTITAIPVKAENILMGGFWAGISKTSTGTSRTAIDHARMQMMQQYLAAVLNFHMFGSIGEGVLANARAVYCGTNASAIQAEIGILGNLNQSGDTLGTTPGGSATTKTSKFQADIDAWDTPTNPVD